MPNTELIVNDARSLRIGQAAQHIVTLPRELTIYTVGEVHSHMLDGLAAASQAPGPWTIDASALEEIDGAGLQLLLSLQCAAEAAAADFLLDAPSAALVDACQALGLAALLPATAGNESRA